MDVQIITKESSPEPEAAIWEVPICCREGWPSCPHVLQKQKKVKSNIGL